MADSQDRFFNQLSAFLGQQLATDYSQPAQAVAGVPGSLEELSLLLQAPRLREVRFIDGRLVFFDGTDWLPVVAATATLGGIHFPLSFPITF